MKIAIVLSKLWGGCAKARADWYLRNGVDTLAAWELASSSVAENVSIVCSMAYNTVNLPRVVIVAKQWRKAQRSSQRR